MDPWKATFCVSMPPSPVRLCSRTAPRRAANLSIISRLGRIPARERLGHMLAVQYLEALATTMPNIPNRKMGSVQCGSQDCRSLPGHI
jgi:hypothetical protein